MSDYLDPSNQELLKDYFAEADLQVDTLEQNILVLENEPSNHDAIDEIFRAAHTLKGASATVQMDELTSFTHLVEDVFDEIRSGKLTPDSELVDLVLAAVDTIKEMLASRKQGAVYDKDISQVQGRLAARIGREVEAGASDHRPADEEAEPEVEPVESGLSEYDELELKETADGKPVFSVTVRFDESNPMNTVGGIQVFAALKSVGTVLKTVPEFDDLYEDVFHPEVVYFVAGDVDATELKNAADISDVTLDADVEQVDLGREKSPSASATPSASAAVESKADPSVAMDDPHRPDTASTDRAAAESTGAAATQVEAAAHKPTATQEEPPPPEPSAQGPSATGKEGGEQKEPADHREDQRAVGSVLRVDSRRIDDLLNLVSETVINKAGFNQVTNQFSEALTLLQTAENDYRETLRALFDSLPEYLEKIQAGASIKEVRRDISTRFGRMYSIFDGFEGVLKNGIAKFRNTAQNLGRITSELQEGVMRIRMVPIKQIFSRFPRLVRDLSRSLKRKVVLEIEGEDTELDKSVIEDLLDPLIHCVRNSMDHGIEAPAERAENGKPEQGTVHLKASNEGNMILIEISDDGRGIDVDTIRAKAVERGVIHPNKALSDVEAFNLIFDAGFSTAKKITDISGRGVGLDVVKRQIEKLNGTVSVWSERGMGTTFTIKIPLTLAIIQGLLVKVGAETYAIPITSVLDSHRIKPSEIKMIDNYEVFNVREDVVSLLRLNRLFKIPGDEARDYYFVVIVGSGDKKMGLIVDQLIGEEDVVIKPLRDHYTNAPGIAGANITGDGSVSLIIDVSQLLELGLKREMELRKQRETTIR